MMNLILADMCPLVPWSNNIRTYSIGFQNFHLHIVHRLTSKQPSLEPRFQDEPKMIIND